MAESENRRCAVVTGSTRGIGRAVARELAAAGMNVVVNSSSGRSLPAAEAVAAEIAEEFGVETLAVAANVADAAEAEALTWPGVYYVRTWLNEGRCEVGDSLMYVLIGADIRPNCIDALQKLVGHIKNELVGEKEIFA